MLFKAAFLLLLSAASIQALVKLPKDLTLTAFDTNFFRTPSQLGVEHLQLLGDANGRSVLLHVFLRMVRHNDRNLFYGKAFFEASEGSAFLPHHEQFLDALPELVLRGEKTHQEHTISVVKNPQWPLHLAADFEDQSKVFRFIAKGWPRYRQLVPSIVQDVYDKTVHPEVPAVYGVMSSVYTDDHTALFAAKVLIHNILYHLKIGYSGMIVYVRPNTMKFFYNSAVLQDLVRQGTVVFVLWTALANLGDSHGVYFDQWIICNHATVAFWQQHVYLNFLDPDEYLATEKEMTVPEMIRTCFQEGADMYRFLIYNLKCEHCVYSERRATTEREMWLAKNTTDPLKSYTQMHIPEGRGSKIFMNPNFAVTLYNHFANMEANAVVTEVEGNCAYMAHLVHLFWYRPHVVNRKDFSHKTSWWYVHDNTKLTIF